MSKLIVGFIALVSISLVLGFVLPFEFFLSRWIILIVLVVQFFFLFYLRLGDVRDE